MHLPFGDNGLEQAYSIGGPRATCGPEALPKWPSSWFSPKNAEKNTFHENELEIPTVFQN